ncbi:hypothetical protein NM688_g7293 [Phlebia brevispora]|uniref:Uncharacterized protein n=1 Tax=Phlebia brevispora TaxID=194682 RepID=A0ACC1S6X4_9APHY|nr:hypothetical protein NM688_g7293 [Phlebia brevispora]
MSAADEIPGDISSYQESCAILDEMTQSMSSTREVVKTLQKKLGSSEIDVNDGISLLSTKAQVMVSYLQSLSILSARRALGHSLLERSAPAASFSSADRGARGVGAGDRVDAMIESRIVLEKIKVLEGRMRYQIEKLVRVAEEAPETAQSVVDDPLAFKPNPGALLNNEMSADEESGDEAGEEQERDGVYRPPKLAPMPYVEPQKKKDKERHLTRYRRRVLG